MLLNEYPRQMYLNGEPVLIVHSSEEALQAIHDGHEPYPPGWVAPPSEAPSLFTGVFQTPIRQRRRRAIKFETPDLPPDEAA